MKKNLIFLDIDGVLNNSKSLDKAWSEHRSNGIASIDPDCLNNLIDICKETNAFICISSAWRMFTRFDETWIREGNKPNKDFESDFNDLLKLLKDSGLNVIGQTPNLARNGEWTNFIRGQEINKWLTDEKEKDWNWIIIDDNSLFFFEWQLAQAVITSEKLGLTSIDAAHAIILLNGE